MMNNESREALRVALGDREAAEAALAHARETADRARSILEEVVREGERLDAIERRAADALADNMRSSLVSGAPPSAPASDRDVSKSAAARAALDARSAAAQRVVSDFAAAEREAAEAFQDAQAAVSAAVKDVVRSEAARLASRWAAVDQDAHALRARLGSAYGLVSNVGALDAAVLQAINLNTDVRVDMEVNAAVEASWSTLAAELAQNSEAQIDFALVDRVRAEAKANCERAYASDEEIQVQLAQMRARPATPEPDWLDLMNDEAIA
jgi:golgin subfamily B member 1